MQFIIFQKNLNKFFCNKGKVIVFDNEQEASNFANHFYQTYALPTAMQEIFSSPSLIGLVMNSANSWEVQILPEKYSYEIVKFETLGRK